MADYYAFVVRGHLDAQWAAWFDDFTISNLSSGNAVLSGPIEDQAALHGVLSRIRDLGLPLLEVRPLAQNPAEPLDATSEEE